MSCSSATAVERPLCPQCYPTRCSRSKWRVPWALVQRFRCRSGTKAAAATAGIGPSPATSAATSATATSYVPGQQYTFTPQGVCSQHATIATCNERTRVDKSLSAQSRMCELLSDVSAILDQLLVFRRVRPTKNFLPCFSTQVISNALH